MEGFTREGTILHAFERCLVVDKGGGLWSRHRSKLTGPYRLFNSLERFRGESSIQNRQFYQQLAQSRKNVLVGSLQRTEMDI